MADLQTALSNIKNEINQWDKEEESRMTKTVNRETAPNGKIQFGVTNNVTRITFDYIKATPGVTTISAVETLSKQGFKESSVTSIISQLVAARQVAKDENKRLYALVGTYNPMKASDKSKAKTTAKAKPKTLKITLPKKQAGNTHQPSAGIAALPPQSEQPKRPALPEWTPQATLKGLDVLQAKALYDELHKLFGA